MPLTSDHERQNTLGKNVSPSNFSGKENFDVATDGDDMDDFQPQKKQSLERWTWTYRILAKFCYAVNFATAVNIIISLACQYDYLSCC